MGENLLLIGMLFLSLVVSVGAGIWGFRTKRTENLIAIQAIPTVYLILVVLFSYDVSTILYSETGGSGFEVGMIVILPTVLFVVASTTVLGLTGLLRQMEDRTPLLTMSSLIATSACITYIFGFLVLPVLLVVILINKAKRKWKQKRDKAPNIIG